MNGGGPALVPLGPDRLRVERGPVSLIIAARWGGETRPALLEAAGRRTLEVLSELAEYRTLVATDARRIRHAQALPPVVGAMWEATLPHRERFLTPLIAVAGAVADSIANWLAAAGASWILVNNGGDVAIRLAAGESATVGVAARLGAPPSARFRVTASDSVGGVATSGFGGRSFTLGIADAVTVVGESGAAADAAATLVANDVDVESRSVERVLAGGVDPETDLRGLRVTRSVGPLSAAEVARALDRGGATAADFLERGLIRGALLFLRGERRLVGFPGSERLEFSPGGEAINASVAGGV
ncbi:MAG: UPF0280 family protein [Deltaproteobacteria bacterium]|nr:UPF0280 family protein [Deltaproteobacteria bacterium]